METIREARFRTRGSIPGLSSEEELWRHRDEPRAREELLRRHMDFARGLALKFRTGPDNVDDLIQVAYLGLVNAVQRFDPSRGIPFQAFASPTINGELKRHFRDRTAPVRVPRSLYERISEVDNAVSELSADLKQSPSVSEIASELGAAEDEVLEAMEAKQSRYPVSFDAPQSDESPDLTPAEKIGDVDGGFSEAEDHVMLVEAAAGLSEREREVLRMRFREEMTQSEIADSIGHSQMHVSRILRRTLDRLRSRIPAESH
jgi:RNA polymerase sigma-B factor